ncbi:MAG: hypothetical protein JO307_19750 [Bryobacterales bacterium]|nr:hypothetical protein [Bryobacterales bacterium]
MEKLIIDLKDGLENQIRSLENGARAGFGRIEVRFDTQARGSTRTARRLDKLEMRKG